MMNEAEKTSHEEEEREYNSECVLSNFWLKR